MNRDELFTILIKLPEAQLEAVIGRSEAPREHFPSSAAAQSTRADALLRWADIAPGNHDRLLQVLRKERILAEPAPGPAEAAPQPVTDLPSRVPIVIAIETADAPLKERHLLRTERHLTVTLDPAAADELERFGAAIPAAGTIGEIHEAGRAAWAVLKTAQDRLDGLFDAIDQSQGAAEPYPQPVAWTGMDELLCRIHRALLAAYRIPAPGRGRRRAVPGAPGIVSMRSGQHYFHPLAAAGSARSMTTRRDDLDRSGPEIALLALGAEGVAEGDALARISAATAAEVVLLSADAVDGPLRSLAGRVAADRESRTRLAIGLGAAEPTPELVNAALATIPCISLGGPGLAGHRIAGWIRELSGRRLQDQSAATAIARLRNAALEQAERDGDVAAFRAALLWTTWSWVGRPLFSAEFGEIARACYPSLLDLRSVAERDWYVDREEGIPSKYQARSLLKPLSEQTGDAPPRFHLYLTGAGGTGKSCFLRNLHNHLRVNVPSVLPVWYKVDAPSSIWKEVEQRIKEETIRALEHAVGADAAAPLYARERNLGPFLRGIVDRLRETRAPIDEICLFVDQLERTFESGDNPDLGRLSNISERFIDLLGAVGHGQGVRVFIASRKQYLPDFLSSFEMAETYKLHFFVLNVIDNETERVKFVEDIVAWCVDEELVHPETRLDREACVKLAREVGGHPLNMMLAIIRTLSRGWDRRITVEDFKGPGAKPWEDLFYVDELLFAKDDLDWYFLLAMAHARTEIVRFSEVWWRLRLVSPEIARRADALGRQAVRERLWLLGHLGRTIHARPLGTDKAGFLEFFHANLRDNLVGTVMNYGGGQGLETRRRGMPGAWRALDRLAAAARDWKQSQQLMQRDDLRMLMDHKDVLVEPVEVDDPDGRVLSVPSLYLLFLRDNDENRPELFESAKECFVYSAVVHDMLGRWAFRSLFPDITDQVALCQRWLPRSDRDSRVRILQFLLELRQDAHPALLDLVLQREGGEVDSVWPLLADILAEPLFAARYRAPLMIAAIGRLLEDGIALPGDNAQTRRFGAFCAAACNGSAVELNGLLRQMQDTVASVQDARVHAAVEAIIGADELAEWLGSGAARGIDLTVASREIHGHVPARIELRLGPALAEHLGARTVEDWTAPLAAEIGLPVPRIAASRDEIAGGNPRATADARDDPAATAVGQDDHLAALLIDGRAVAVGAFPPGHLGTLRRHWDLAGKEPPAGALVSHDEASRECMVWLPQGALDAAGWDRPAVTPDEAMQRWLAKLLRRRIADLFTIQDLMPFLDRAAGTGPESNAVLELMTTTSRDLRGLWRVLINLAHERIAPEPILMQLIVELLALVRQIRRADHDQWTQRLRESLLRHRLCRIFADQRGQLPVMLLETEVEDALIARLRLAERQRNLDLASQDALALTAAVTGHFETVLRQHDVSPVLVCDPRIRLPLFRILNYIDSRIFVLGYTELSEDMRPRSFDVITGVTIAGQAAVG